MATTRHKAARLDTALKELGALLGLELTQSTRDPEETQIIRVEQVLNAVRPLLEQPQADLATAIKEAGPEQLKEIPGVGEKTVTALVDWADAQ